MARITSSTQLQSLKTVDELGRFVAKFLNEILGQFNGKIDFGDNIRTSAVTVTFLTGGSEVVVKHSLGRLPVGYLITTQNAVGNVFLPASGKTLWDETQIVLKGSLAMTVELLIL